MNPFQAQYDAEAREQAERAEAPVFIPPYETREQLEGSASPTTLLFDTEERDEAVIKEQAERAAAEGYSFRVRKVSDQIKNLGLPATRMIERGSLFVGGVLITPEDAIRQLLSFLGENPYAPEHAETPRRVLDAFIEMAGSDRNAEPATILGSLFPVSRGVEYVEVEEVGFASLCRHHLLPFSGTAAVTYWPNPEKGVVGLSKIARLVAHVARRLQMQESLASEVADTLRDYTDASRVEVVMTATHSCMACRGVKDRGAKMIVVASSDRPYLTPNGVIE